MVEVSIASPEIQGLVQEIAGELGLFQVVKFQALNISKQKEVVKVQRATNISKALSDKEVFVLVYEKAFDNVDEKTKYMWLRMALDVVSYDYEKDKVNLSAPMINMTLSTFQKFGSVAGEYAELAYHTVNQLEEEEKKKKKEKKNNKKSKNNKNE